MATRVSFKTKRGRRVSFTANTGRRRRVTPQMRLIGRAGKACKGEGKIGSRQRTSCLREFIKEHK